VTLRFWRGLISKNERLHHRTFLVYLTLISPPHPLNTSLYSTFLILTSPTSSPHQLDNLYCLPLKSLQSVLALLRCSLSML